MRLALTHPEHGYYTRKDRPVFGAAGDFVTSPEISQIFGECLGVWLYMQMTSASPVVTSSNPRKYQLIEFGPGKGTLVCDLIRVPHFLLTINVFSPHFFMANC